MGKRADANDEGMTALGTRIKERRLELKLTQEQLGGKAHCTKGAVSQWEKGDIKNLRMERIVDVADALGLEIRWLITGNGPRLLNPALDPEFIRDGEAMSRLRRALPAWRRYVTGLAAIENHKTQQDLLDVMQGPHTTDERVAESFGTPGAKP